MHLEKRNNAVLKQDCHSPKFLRGIFHIRNASGEKQPKKYEEDPRTLRAAFSGMIKCVSSGFTLIELLVVILIIGILAAVALPQYQLAVEKSRTTELYALLKGLYTAQHAYYLEHGTYAKDFTLLDLKFPYDDKKEALVFTGGKYTWRKCMDYSCVYACKKHNTKWYCLEISYQNSNHANYPAAGEVYCKENSNVGVCNQWGFTKYFMTSSLPNFGRMYYYKK